MRSGEDVEKELCFANEIMRNLLVAALVLRCGAGGEDAAVRALQTRDSREFAFQSDAFRWNGWSFDAAACEDTRAHLLRSVGSCSFEEPVTELRALGWLGDGGS